MMRMMEDGGWRMRMLDDDGGDDDDEYDDKIADCPEGFGQSPPTYCASCRLC